MMEKYQHLFAVKLVLMFSMITCLVQTSPWKTDNSPNASLDDIGFLWPSRESIEACVEDVNECDFPEYPSMHIEELIRKNIIKSHWFSKIDYEEKIGMTFTNNTDIRFFNLCDSQSVVVYPKGGITSKGEFAYVIQMQVDGKYYHQAVTNVICGNGNSANCIINDNITHEISDAACGQFRNRTYTCVKKFCKSPNLIGIDRNKNVVRDITLMPSCCCMCEYRV